MSKAKTVGSELAQFLSGLDARADMINEKAEKPYQTWLYTVIDTWLKATRRDEFRLKAEAITKGVKPVRVFGTSFWPDLAIETEAGDLVLAIEVKCLNRASLPDLVVQALGQAVIYREEYSESLVVFVPIEDVTGPTGTLIDHVSSYGVMLAVVRHAPKAGRNAT